ncbi:MAG: hypothetical protein IT210_15965 [Armatimonadetes bacterium]|nr:hypothetical protein [Armatimonadota bacterium]
MDETLKAYRDRWTAVEEIERREIREASIEWRWQQVNRLYSLATALGLMPDRPEEDQEIILHRWDKLRASHERTG